MLKIMLVDDEILVRIGIKSILNWEEYGYTIAGEASDGEEALEKIKANVPDIVLTDLVMEKMNGFELIKVLRKEYPSVKIIVLSCYNDFDNVKEAMKLGASDYIFKLTIKPQELLKTLDAAKEQMNTRSVDHSGVAKDRILYKNLDAIKSKILRMAIEKSYGSMNDMKREIQEVNMRVDLEQPYFIINISIDEFYLINRNSVIKEKELLKFSMQNILSEVMEKYAHSEVVDFDGGDVLILVNSGPQEDLKKMVDSLLETYELMKEYMKRYLGIGISGGMSQLHININELDQAHAEASSALESRFYCGGARFYVYKESKSQCTEPNMEFLQTVSDELLVDYVENLDDERLKSFINTVFGCLEDCGNVPRHKIRTKLLEMLYPFFSAAKKRGIDMDSLKNECGYTPYQVITQYDSLKHIKEWFLKFIDDFVEECRKKGQNKCREEIARVKEYVRIHLDSEMNISMAASFVNMSESYFSHLFKKETGSSFIDYVNSLKIDRAKELILQTDLKVYEIASKVGFDNANYFSILFKKVTGKSPNDYRK